MEFFFAQQTSNSFEWRIFDILSAVIECHAESVNFLLSEFLIQALYFFLL